MAPRAQEGMGVLIQVFKLHGAEGFINRDAARVYKPLEQQVGGSSHLDRIL